MRFKVNPLDGQLIPDDDNGANVSITQSGGGGGGGGGGVDSVVPGNNISVDATDSANPIVATTPVLDEVDAVEFNTAYTPTGSEPEGSVYWNNTDKTLDLIQDGTTLQLGQELHTRVRNPSGGSTILNGSAVYISGSTGVFPDVALARSDAEATGRVLGVVTEDIASPGFGFVTTYGYVRGIKTDYTGAGAWGTTWASGDALYVSKTDAGVLTNVEPSTPHHADLVATVGVVHPANGSILIGLDRHVALTELSDVNGTALTTSGQVPVWDNANQYFDFTDNITNKFDKVADDSDDITEGAANLFLTTDERTKLSNTSGTNTGDQTSIVGITGTTAEFNTANTDADFYTTNGTDVTLADGGTGASLTDPNADRIFFWDDSAGSTAFLTPSTGLTLSGTNLTVRTASASQTGIVELATTAETQTGTDATRAVTPDGLNDMTSLTSKAWFLDEDNMASNDATKVASQQSIKAYVDAAITAAKIEMQIKVGGLYITASTTNPATELGYGTWSRIEGRFIVGVSETDSDFDLNDIGGTKTETLTVDQIPSHKHNMDTRTFTSSGAPTTNGQMFGTTSGTRNADDDRPINNTGGGQAHNNLPPYIAKYIWQRSA